MRDSIGEVKRRRVLIVEDSKEANHNYARSLARAGFEVHQVSGSEVLKRLMEESFDASIISAPKTNGLDLLRDIRERSPDLPVILILDAVDNRTAIRASKLGAVQSLVKPHAPELLEAAGAAIQHKKLRSRVTELWLRRHLSEPSESFTATTVKNEFGRILDTVLQGRPVYITKHDAPKAVLLSIEDYNSLIRSSEVNLDSLSDEFDTLLAHMQTPEARRRMSAAFNASPKQLGEAAVAAARKRG